MIPEQERLPRRDFVILPLLCALSILLTVGVAEVSARIMFPARLQDSCAVPTAGHDVTFKPNCHSEVKSVESPWIENTYNACGYRTADPCDPKPAGGYRVVMLGASISSGYLVPYAETAAARLIEALRARCSIPVDVQNLATPGVGIEKAVDHLDAALTLKPNVIVMVISGHDLEVLPAEPRLSVKAGAGVLSPRAAHGLRAELRDVAQAMRTSRTVEVAQHFMYEDLDVYLPLYLQHGDEADFLRPPLSQAWQNRLAIFEHEITTIQTRARQAGVVFMLVFVPPRADALLLKWKHRPINIDPQMLGRALASNTRRDHADYLDLTQTIGSRPDVSKLYYPLDSHPDGAANGVMAHAIERALLDHGSLPKTCRGQTEVVQ